MTMFVSATALFTLGLLSLFVKVPDKQKYKGVRNIGIGLSVCYLTLAAFSFFGAMTGYDANMDIASLCVGSVQATALTGVMATLISPDKLDGRYFRIQTVFVVLLAMAGACMYIDALNNVIVIRIVMGIIYGTQCYLCMRHFNKVYRTAAQRLEVVYDENMQDRLQWARWGFYGGLAVGIMAYATIGMGEKASIAFSASYTVYYVMLAVYYVRYILHLSFYAPILTPEAIPMPEPIVAVTVTVPTSTKEAVDGWIARKGYLEEKATADIADELQVNIAHLREYVKMTYGEDFRTWRTRLRIEEACRMLCEHPEMSTMEIGKACGIPNKGNFHTYFTRFTNETPAQYREKNGMQGAVACLTETTPQDTAQTGMAMP